MDPASQGEKIPSPSSSKKKKHIAEISTPHKDQVFGLNMYGMTLFKLCTIIRDKGQNSALFQKPIPRFPAPS